jgi:adenine/guanine/hypoxanthine permease
MVDWNSVGLMAFAILAVAVNGIPQLLYAKEQGFKLKSVAYAYFLAAGLNLMLGSVTPISAQAETITVAANTKEMRARITALVMAAVVMTLLGLFGLVSKIADWAGAGVVAGMMAGVGLMLCEVSYTFTKKDWQISLISIVSAVGAWMLLKSDSNAVVYTIGISVALSTLYYNVRMKVRGPRAVVITAAEPAQKKSLVKEWLDGWRSMIFSKTAILAALGLVCMGIGCNISFGNITASIANTTQNLNHLTIVNAVADFVSVPAGGLPLEGIISGTAGAPNPVLTGVLMMAFIGILIVTGAVEKLAKYVPAESISGFLLVIGFVLTVLPSIGGVIATGAIAAGMAAMGMTILSKNPFYGMVAGVIVKLLGPMLGI